MINFLGIGSAFNTCLGNTSAFLKKNASLLLIDCGSTVFNRLQKLDLLVNVSNMYIIITHTHPDHIGSLGELIFYSHYILKHKPKIFFPDSKMLISILSNMGVSNEFYDIFDNQSASISDSCLETIDLTFVPASHVDKIPCYGVMLKNNMRSIYYSGDSNKVNESVLKSLENGQIDTLYQDTCSLDYLGNPHLYIGRLAEHIKPSLRSRVYCMHLDQSFDEEKAKQLGFNVVEVISGL